MGAVLHAFEDGGSRNQTVVGVHEEDEVLSEVVEGTEEVAADDADDAFSEELEVEEVRPEPTPTDNFFEDYGLISDYSNDIFNFSQLF